MSAARRVWGELERLIHRDPGRRGLIESEAGQGGVCPGHLAAAADHLARVGKTVWITTGFFIPGANPPAAETDGPPGAALLAAALCHSGLKVRLLTDEWCASAVQVAAELYELPPPCVAVCPCDLDSAQAWLREQLSLAAVESLTHLIAVERVGPSHTLASFAGCRDPSDPAIEMFCQLVPASHRGRCHNMRGEIIDDFTAPLHELFVRIACERPAVRTIGIGDGGNEIGMGSISWNELRVRLKGEAAAWIPCRIPTDWTVVAGVSNWGAQALALAVCWFRGTTAALLPYHAEAERQRMEELVRRGPAVDGVTRLPQATVDGLPFLTYIQPWEGMRRWIEHPS